MASWTQDSASLMSFSSVLTSISIFVSGALYVIYTRDFTPLRSIPGPFLASISKLWIFNQQRGYQRQKVDINLHKKYGPIVRVAPNEVSLSSPEALRKIYGAGSKFRKGDWYIGASDAGWSGPDTLDFLPEQNMEKYRIQRRATGPAYTVDSMKDLEDNLDKILEKNIKFMRSRPNQPVDVDIFFNYFASDCLAMITFSECRGLVEANEDDGSISFIHDLWKYMHLAGYFPFAHRSAMWFLHRVVFGWMKHLPSWTAFGVKKDTEIKTKVKKLDSFSWAEKEIQSRVENKEKFVNQPPNDISTKLFQIQAERGVLKDHWLKNMCMTNFGAGVETIGITVSTLIAAVVRNGCQDSIYNEIDTALQEGRLSKTPKLRELQDTLPYLNACIQESMRLHAVVGMPLVRVVPDGGVELEGKFLPAGTTVGINPWVLSRDQSLYGKDAEIWRPERWLEYSPEKTRSLEAYSMVFGTGARSCPGKHLARAIFTKMIPMLFMNLEWSFTDPQAETVTRCTFSIRSIKCMVQWKTREEAVTV